MRYYEVDIRFTSNSRLDEEGVINLERDKIAKIRLSVRLKQTIREGLKKKANKLGISDNAAISLAVSNYIKS
jgi:hypothetical protein